MANDYIRRDDAVEAIGEEYAPRTDFERGMVSQLSCDKEKIKALPSADVVQVKHGKWKKIGVWGRVYRCDQCGNFLDFDGVNAGRGSANFCPNCMAKMDGEE